MVTLVWRIPFKLSFHTWSILFIYNWNSQAYWNNWFIILSKPAMYWAKKKTVFSVVSCWLEYLYYTIDWFIHVWFYCPMIVDAPVIFSLSIVVSVFYSLSFFIYFNWVAWFIVMIGNSKCLEIEMHDVYNVSILYNI